METAALLQRLKASRIRVDLQGNDLKISAPRGALTADIVTALRQHKPALIALLRAASAAGAEYTPIPHAPVQPAGTYAPSHSQRRLWMIEHLAHAKAAYSVPGMYLIEGPLDREAMGRALERVVERHESLRTVFVTVDGQVYQKIIPEHKTTWVLRETELAPDREELEAALAGIFYREAGEPFALDTGPLARALLVRVAPDRHGLFLNIHHILGDAWSLEVLVRDLAEAYHALTEPGHAAPGRPLSIQYKDFAAWQNARLEEPETERYRRYWMDRLGTDVPVLALPTDRPRPAVRTFAGDAAIRMLNPALARRLKTFAGEHDATLFMVLLTAVHVLLSRYSGQDDMVIGVPMAGRDHPDLEEQIGFYSNTLALRNQLDRDLSVVRALAHIRDTTLAAYRHQDYPFDRLVDDLRVGRDPSRSPLFDVLMSVRHVADAPLRMGALTVRALNVSPRSSKFDLSFHFFDTGAGLKLATEYSTDLFDGATVERMGGHIEELLRNMVADPHQAIGRVPMLTEPEKRALLAHARMGDRPGYTELSVVELFRAQATQIPGAPAVVCEDRMLTYAALKVRSGALSRRLRAVPAGPGERVAAVLLRRSERSVVAMLGVLESGMCYAPLGLDLPDATLAFILDDVRPAVLITERALATRLGSSALAAVLPEVVLIDELVNYQHGNGDAANGAAITARDPAYLIFTSGSTGTPKCVVQTHGTLSNLIRWQMHESGIEPGLRLLQYCSFAFDVSLQDVLFALASGGTVHVAPDGLRGNFHALARYLVEQRIELLSMPFAVLGSFMQEMATPGDRPDSLAGHGLRHITTYGEQVFVTGDLEAFLRRNREVSLHNHYGPSETHVVTAHVLSAGRGNLTPRAPIGRPIANTGAWVVDHAMDLQPEGVPGVLVIGGANVARGYMNRPETTDERFVRLPFAQGAVYVTGDICRWNARGDLEYLGRNDDQVKLRGYRIELGEIEHKLRQLPGIAEAAVTVRRDDHGDAFLAAYYTMDETAEAAGSPDAPAEALRNVLPAYMVPLSWTRLERMPLSATGKLDRKSLPDAEPPRRDSAAYVAPRGDMETRITALWAEVLEGEHIGVHDDFFAVGGNSLRAIQLVSKLSARLDLHVTLEQLFAHPTIAGLASIALSRKMSGEPAPGLETVIPRAPEQEHYALSNAQKRMWLFEKLYGQGSTAYVLCCPLELHGALDAGALSLAMDRVIARHETLRTAFIEIDGEPRQRIHEPMPCNLEVSDLRQRPDHRDVVHSFIERDKVTPFHLDEAPLLRGKLFRLDETLHVLVFSIHHILIDEDSMEVFFDDLMRIYYSLLAGEDMALPPLRIQYRDYAEWHNRFLAGEAMAAHRAYWLKTLAPPRATLDLPTDMARPAAMQYRGTRIELILGEGERAALQAMCRRESATWFMLLVALVKALLFKYTGQNDILVGTPVSSRDNSDLERQVGFFLNTVILRDRIDAGASIIALLHAVKATITGALAHQHYPYDDLINDLAIRREANRNPLFDVWIVMNRIRAPGEAYQEIVPHDRRLRVEAIATEYVTAKFDLVFKFIDAPRHTALLLEYSTELFRPETAERMLQGFDRLVKQAIEAPDVPLDRIHLVDTSHVAASVTNLEDEW